MSKTVKTCTRCQIEKPISEFYGEKRSYCKECERTEASARMNRYNATFRGKASGALQSAKKAARRVEREQGIEITDDLTIYNVLWTLGEEECSYCGKEIEEKDRTLDHIIPLRYGGTNTFDNITMACRTCNTIKSDLPLITYMIQQETETDAALKLIDRMSRRSRRTFDEVFKQLAEDAKTYYEIKAVEAIEKIDEVEGEDMTG